jgi:succinate dehydrogenase / fumarate reductase cytochrome b subunit
MSTDKTSETEALTGTTFVGTSIGKKVVMAVTGFIVFGFVAVHITGNLLVFRGPDAINQYAALLQGLGPGLWVFRGVLFLSVVLHIITATQVSLQSLGARPVGYRSQRFRDTTYAARTMRWGGPVIALFVIYHLLHLTFGVARPPGAGFDPLNVYNNVVTGFQVWWISAVYMIAMAAVGLHLYHGLWSMFQSLGLAHAKWNDWRRLFAVVFACAVTAAGLSIPISVLVGAVGLVQGGQ